MKMRNAEATRLENDYMERLKEAIRSCDPEDAEEIRQGVKEHIEEAVNAKDSEEVNLVEMAEVLERLGAPEAYARDSAKSEPERPPTSPAAASQTQLDEDRTEWQAFLSKLWIAKLVGVIGLFIPIINLYICDIISVIMIMFALKADIVTKSRELRGCRQLIIFLLAVLCISPVTGMLSLGSPIFGILDLPVSLGVIVLSLVFYWKVMTGLGELVTEYGKDDVAKRIYSARTMYIALTLVILAVAIVIGVGIALGTRPSQKEQLVMQMVIGLVTLPVTWLIGWFFSLRPVSMANKALD